MLRDEIENLFHQISNFEMGTRYKKKYLVVEREISLLNLTRFFEIEKSRHALIGSRAVTFLIYTGVVFRIDWGSGWFFCNREKYGLWQTTIRLNLDERLEFSPFFQGRRHLFKIGNFILWTGWVAKGYWAYTPYQHKLNWKKLNYYIYIYF